MTVRVGVCQLDCGVDVALNLDKARDAVSEAVARGCTLAVLPECLDYNGPLLGREEAFRQSGMNVLKTICRAAANGGIWLIAGSIHEPSPVPGKFYNTSYMVDASGEVVAKYRKLHMFDVDLECTGEYNESEATVAGDEIVVVAAAGLTVGMSICYDVRFAELYRAQRNRGADVLTIPAAFTFETGAAHWELLLRARAIENQCFVLAADQIGEYLPGRRSYGRSMIVDPWGVILAEAPNVANQVAIAELDMESLYDLRKRMPMRPRISGYDMEPASGKAPLAQGQGR